MTSKRDLITIVCRTLALCAVAVLLFAVDYCWGRLEKSACLECRGTDDECLACLACLACHADWDLWAGATKAFARQKSSIGLALRIRASASRDARATRWQDRRRRLPLYDLSKPGGVACRERSAHGEQSQAAMLVMTGHCRQTRV